MSYSVSWVDPEHGDMGRGGFRSFDGASRWAEANVPMPYTVDREPGGCC